MYNYLEVILCQYFMFYSKEIKTLARTNIVPELMHFQTSKDYAK